MCEIIEEFKMGLSKVQPDLLICDFISAFGAHAADELQIPVVI